MDDWQHYLRSPDNNPISTDTMIGPPHQIQWMATREAVFIAGPPDGFSALGEGEAALELKDVESALGAWRGKESGIVYAADARSGTGLRLPRLMGWQ